MALAWSIASSLSVVPHSLSYYNELAGGPLGGHHHLGNSNSDWGQGLLFLSDWGQGLLFLRDWCISNPDARPLRLAYDMPLIDPRIIGIEYAPIPEYSRQPSSLSSSSELKLEPGWYAISVNLLHSREHYYDYFLKLKPTAMAGYSIYIYHVTPQDADRLRRERNLPPLPDG